MQIIWWLFSYPVKNSPQHIAPQYRHPCKDKRYNNILLKANRYIHDGINYYLHAEGNDKSCCGVCYGFDEAVFFALHQL